MKISSTEELSKQLIGILSSRNIEEMKSAMGDNQDYWISVFQSFNNLDFSHLQKYYNFSHTSNYSYISLDVAIRNMPNFSKGSIAYGNAESQEKKFKQLLMALSFLDCDLYVTLITKRFKWSVVEQILDRPASLDNKENNNDQDE